MIIFLLQICFSTPIFSQSGNTLIIDGSGDVYKENMSLLSISSIIKIEILGQITSLGPSCFSGFTKLQSITLPDSLEIIHNNVFESTSLISLKIGPLVNKIVTPFLFYKTKTISYIEVNPANKWYYSENGILYDASKEKLLIYPSGLVNGTIRDDVKQFDQFSFYGVSGSFQIPDSLEKMSFQTFVDALELQTVSFGLGSKLQKIPGGCFWQNSLNEFVCPPSVSCIESDSFRSVGLNTFRFLGESNLITLESGAFNDCWLLESVYLPKSIQFISETAFISCPLLSTMSIEQGGKYFENVGTSVFSKDRSRLVFISPKETELTLFEETQNISQSVLQKCANLTNVVIPSSNNFLSEYLGVIYSQNFSVAKFALGGINETSIHEKCSTLSDSLFEGCKKLITINFPQTSNIKTIPSNCFRSCSIKRIKLPSKITSLQNGVFYESDLEEIEIPSSVTSFGEWCFWNSCCNIIFAPNSSLTTLNAYCFKYFQYHTLNLPDSVEVISDSCFEGSKIQNFTIPYKVNRIGESTFKSSFIKRFYASESSLLSTFAANSFADCTELVLLQLPPRLFSIGIGTFKNCVSLKTIQWVGTPLINTLVGSSFESCTLLESFEIPQSLVEISTSAFFNCVHLTKFTFLSDHSKFTIEDGVLYNIDGVEIILCPPGKTAVSLRKITSKIGNLAFHHCTELVNVTINPESGISELTSKLFYQCFKLSSIFIPASINSISNSAFEECTSLTCVTFGKESELVTLSSKVFYNCNSLKTIQFEGNSSLTTIEANAFAHCTSLETVDFGPNPRIQIFGEECFADCVQLQAIEIPISIVTISRGCFSGCSRLVTIYFSQYQSDKSIIRNQNGVSLSLESGAFSGCIKLEVLRFPSNLGSIATDSFAGCSKISEIYYCGTQSFDVNAFTSPMRTPTVYTMRGYLYESFCLIPTMRVMKSCGLLPTDRFTHIDEHTPEKFGLLVSSLLGFEEDGI